MNVTADGSGNSLSKNTRSAAVRSAPVLRPGEGGGVECEVARNPVLDDPEVERHLPVGVQAAAEGAHAAGGGGDAA